jgi:hypothetical protein
MVVVGCAGQGKSTLVNSLLLIDSESSEAAKEGNEGKTVTKVVRSYSKIRDGARVIIYDTPGLGDDENVNEKAVIDQLHREVDDKCDLCLFCLKYCIGVRVDDGHRNVIKLLTARFGHVFWKKTRLVMTMVNTARKPKEIPALKGNIERQLLQALRNAGVPNEIVDDQRLLLAGIGEELLLVNDGEEEDWNKKLFLHCLDTLNDDKKITLTQLRYGISIWPLITVGTGFGAVGAATTTGAKIGASIGLPGGPAGVAVGAAAGAFAGAAGGWLTNALIRFFSS